MQKQLLFEIFNIIENEESTGIGINVVNDHEIDANIVANILYSVYYRYLNSIDDNVQLKFTKDVKRIFNKMINSDATDIIVDEEQLQDINEIEDVQSDKIGRAHV